MRKDKVVFVTLNLVRCMYYPISLEIFGALSCTLFDQGHDAWFLNAWPWISCNPAVNEFQRMLAVAIPTLILFVCGFPALLWFLVKNNSHQVTSARTEEQRMSGRIRYGFLYLPYKMEYQFWGILSTARLLCFGLVVRIVPYTSLATIFILLLILMQGSIWLQYSKNPYVSNEENSMELLSLYTIFFSYFLVLIAGIVGASSWIIVFVILCNSLVLLLFLWKILGHSILRFFHFNRDIVTNLVAVSPTGN
eukprot:TRINITY_DN6766_c0_g2_i2.p1 TRINITY_DN6766_c0_g2~~TRINITY_DN6766_c0_g2_i2.p1  ORF type:complete len:266 (+),score=17.22 TRINITY_DN6766_c0_g2_i2:51-800(+)